MRPRRAADVIVRGMLTPNNWVNTKGGTVDPRPNSFVIDPRGVAQSPPLGPFGGLTRISLANANSQAEANYVFIATDDLVVPLPEDFDPPQAVGRPQIEHHGRQEAGIAIPLEYAGAYSWLVTVVPQPTASTLFYRFRCGLLQAKLQGNDGDRCIERLLRQRGWVAAA